MTTTAAWEQTGRDGAREDIAAKGEPCTTLDEARRRCAAWLRGVEGADVDAAARGYLATWLAHAQGSAPPLDLDAIEARWRRVGDLAVTRDEDGNLALTDDKGGEGYGIVARMDCDDPGFVKAAEALAGAPRDIAALVARVRDLAAKLDASAQALDDLVAQVWRATGETHEPPADVGALIERVDTLRCESESLARRLTGRDETNANLLGRLIAAENAVAAARREGAEAMREACVARAKDHVAALKSEAAEAARGRRSDASRAFSVAASAAESIVDALRALPLPGGEP